MRIPLGFKAAGIFAGIKKQKKDLSLIASDTLCAAAGCYTKNSVKAAPVLWDMGITNKGLPARGIVTNSGNANACTGKQGTEDARKMAEAYALKLNCNANEILVCSTGVIGVTLPIDNVIEGINDAASKLNSAAESFTDAAEAITTTDTFIKTASAQALIGGEKVTFFGMAKGSGMIHPNMATLLCLLITDCAIDNAALQKALLECTDDTFNMISVDGDTSTNDTTLILANGAMRNTPVTLTQGYSEFKDALFNIMKKLAIDIAKDGEGATKLMEVTVAGAKDKGIAKTLAKAVVSSNLFKAALFGADANWGRVLCAMGYSGAKFNQDLVDIIFKSDNGAVKLMEKGAPVIFNEDMAKNVLSCPKVFIDISLNEGEYEATAWGCDLTYDYVKINGDYRT